MLTGTVRWFDEERGFGFLAPDDGGEVVFCHFSVIQADSAYRSLVEGQRVEFVVFDLPEGRVAGNVRRMVDSNGSFVTAPQADEVRLWAMPYRRPDLAATAERLRPFGEVRATDFWVRLRAPPHELVLFDDGRAIVTGTVDEALARSFAARWLGVRIPE